MKLLLFLALSFSGLFADSSFYDMQFETLDHQTIQTSSLQGKKVIITIVDAENPDTTQLQFLDSVKRTSINLEVIGVLTEDFGKKAKLNEVKKLTRNMQLQISQPMKVKKGAAGQHQLLQWLTTAKENQHFDVDIKSEGQFFLVSGKGTLYAVLLKDTPKEAVNKVLNQPFDQ